MGGAREHLPESGMKKAGVTYTDLVARLKKHGFKEETEGSVTMKLNAASSTPPGSWRRWLQSA